MAKRVVIALYDSASAALVAVLLACAPATPAFAYVDPSVMTYTIQAIAGVAVALSAVAGVALRRGRKALMRILDIDENARREYEPPVHRVSPVISDPAGQEARRSAGEAANEAAYRLTDQAANRPAGEAANEAAGEAKREDAPARPLHSWHAATARSQEWAHAQGLAQGLGRADVQGAPDEHGRAEAGTSPEHARRRRPFLDKRAYKPTWKARLALGAIAAVFFTFTIFFVAPLEIVGGSAGSLVYSMGDVWWVLVPTGLAIIAGITGVLALTRGRAFNIMLTLVFAVGLCAYVQALVLNVGLPAADGATIVWGDYLDMQVISAAVWIAIVACAIIFSLHNRVRAQGVAACVSVFLVIVQAVGLASLAIAPASTKGQPGVDAMNASIDPNAEIVMTEDELFTVNEEGNVVVFVLDTFDTAYLTRALKKNPDLLDELTGFTNYENATAAMIPTRFAIPFMMTGQMPSFDEPFSEYKAKRYARASFLDDIYDAGYSIGLYTDSLRISGLSDEEQFSVTGKTVNMHNLPNSMIDFGGTLYSLYQIGLYRDVPWAFKWGFWYYTDAINSSFVKYDPDAPPEETIYVMDDIRYYNRLRDVRLSIADDGSAGAFRFIHLLGSHYPFNYDEEVNDLGQDNSDVFKQSQGAIRIVSEYVRQLKDLGVYDDTTIIVTADHGYWTITEEPIEETSTPIMFVKPAQSADADAEPIRIDEKPVSHLDLQATVLDAMGLDYSGYAAHEHWEGYSMFDDIDPSRERFYLTTDSLPDLTETQFREYLIDGDALDFGNWSETGRVIDAQT